MLKRLYVDNFRALVNCELHLGRRALLMGANGTGKSTLGDVLQRLQWLVVGQMKSDDVFTIETLTRWQSIPRQQFEIEAIGPAGDYRYEAVVEHLGVASADTPRTRVVREALTLNARPLFNFQDGLVQLYQDDHSAGPQYPFDWGRSALGTVSPRQDNQKLTWFHRWLQGLTVLRPNPSLMEDFIDRDDFGLAPDARNFVAWYHSVSSSDKRRDRSLHDTLGAVLSGFDALNFEFAGQNRWLLRADFSRAGQKVMFRFAELSDGQRALILLYAVLHFLLAEGRTVFLDEPDNFVALEEIQPWLLTAADIVDNGVGQLVVVSHHPEIFNQWAIGHGLVTERDGAGPVRIRKFPASSGTELTPAERIARGWSNNGGNEVLGSSSP